MKMKTSVFKILASIVLGGCCVLSVHSSVRADWPAYRGNGQRGGYTAETLGKNLSLRWTYHSRHKPRPAWQGRDTRMPFDLVYHTVISGKKLFFASSADCKVYALDTETGKKLWTFYTDSPVRFAPAIWKNGLFVTSDDGYLYCLSCKTGALHWKKRGGPSDSMILGNGRMISRWPARGGPVVSGGIVYFAAGIWPSEGIFVYALDAITGKTIWCNDSSGSIYMAQPHGGAYANSGISAQGYLTLANGQLLVPTGRAVPAGLDIKSGKLLYFNLSANMSTGGSETVSAGSLFFNGRYIFSVDKGRRMYKGIIDVSTVAVTPKHIIYTHGNQIRAIDRKKMWTKKAFTDRKGKKAFKRVPSNPVWSMKSPRKGIRSLIAAGDKIIIGCPGAVFVLDMATKKTLRSFKVSGTPYGLAVEGGRLFVSTTEGKIYCFAPKTKKMVLIYPNLLFEADDDGIYGKAAEEIIRRTGLTEGYCLDLGCGGGELSLALAKRTKLHIYAIDSDAKNVAAARKLLERAGLYGVRVTVHQGDPRETAYPDYFANLIVSGRSVTEGATVSKELSRILRPYGGIACIGKPGAMKKIVRGKLEGAGTWTHQYCDAANTICSRDTLVKGPLRVLWFSDFVFQMPSRHGRGPAPLFLDGRMFVEGLNAMRCVDAYNGRKLWEYPLPKILKAYDDSHILGVSGTGSNFCVTGDGLFVRQKDKCLKIDPATGKLLATFETPTSPNGKPGRWGYIACTDGILFGTLSDTTHIAEWPFRRSKMHSLLTESLLYFKFDMHLQPTESNLLFAMDTKSKKGGKMLWSYKPKHSIRNNSIAIGQKRVFLIDRPQAVGDRLTAVSAERRGVKPPKQPTGTLIALDANNGKVLWKSSKNIYGTMLALSTEHDVLLMCYQPSHYRLRSERGGRMAAYRASSGKILWNIRANYRTRPILNGKTIYSQNGKWNLLTGKRMNLKLKRSQGCGILSGSKNLLLYRSSTLGYADLLNFKGTENYGGIRPGCWINAITAGGLVLMPDATDKCSCSFLIKASIALQSKP